MNVLLKDDWDFGDERPLYGLFKQYFNFLDLGRKGTEKRAEIYAYNGGLFKPDAILDALEIGNILLDKYTRKLANYDFESQVDVNLKLSAISKFQTFFSSQYKLEKLSRKLKNWYELEFGEFIKELNKSIKANNKLREKAAKTTDFSPVLVDLLTKKEEFEWMEFFEDNKKKAQELQSQIAATEKEIDQMVYEMYGLTEEEIAIVEKG